MVPWLTIIGIGEDGLDGLGAIALTAIAEAAIIFGGKRHLAMLSDQFKAERRLWATPLSESFEVLFSLRGQKVVVLASGDPMFYGIGASLTHHLMPDEMRVLSAPSSISLTAARMRWPLQDVAVISIHGRSIYHLNRAIYNDAKLIVLSENGFSAKAVADLLTARCFGQSRITVFEHIGGAKENQIEGIAKEWHISEVAALNILAIDCIADSAAQQYSLSTGLPDEVFQNDGQLTKRDVRAITMARLAPLPGQLLWDVGAGCGSISIEWMRSGSSCRAIAIEENETRQAFIAANAKALGVPSLERVMGSAPAVLENLPPPDAVFIGGGVTAPGLFEACWTALKPGGRLVANAVTVQSEILLASWHEKVGGELSRIAVSHAQPLGVFATWRTALPITIFAGIK